jgi:DNA-binding CsgD family transcriptional regulator
MWEKGPEEAKRTKATSPIPSEILDRCRVLKQQWVDVSRANTSQTSLEQVQVHHPRLPHLQATIHLKQLKSAGVARPHFLIRCENLCPDTPSCLPALVGLTRREQEVAQLVCQGRSNQEVADNARLSLPMVKKHLHAVFRKLQVPSRTRLVALAT